MNRKLIDSARHDLQHYAGYAGANARKIERYSTDLAIIIEELNKNNVLYNLPIDHMDNEYSTREDAYGNKLYIKTEGCNKGQFISMGSGCERVALTPDIKRRLNLYGHIQQTMMNMYDELENVDELWLFDMKSNIAMGRIEYEFADYILPGLDVSQLYDLGIALYDWFKLTGKEQNPDRKAVWSPMAFIEMFNQWIMHVTAPVYNHRYSDHEEMIGIIGVHLNLDWLMANTIEKSAVKMMIIKDDSTLIGMNGPAKKDIGLETFNINDYSYATVFDAATIQNKKRFTHETSNLEHNKTDEIVSFAQKAKTEFQFRHTLYGKTYTVLREKVSEIGFSFLALLDDGVE